MAMHPEVQEKARRELTKVVGSGRLPTYEDYDSLHYIQAIYLESVRWNVVVPLGVPHAVTVDDEYRGYHIPKGSIIMAVRVMSVSAKLPLLTFKFFPECLVCQISMLA